MARIPSPKSSEPKALKPRFDLEGFQNYLKANPHLKLCAYLAPEGLEVQVAGFLGEILYVHGQLLITKSPGRFCPWAQDILEDAEVIQIASITDGAKSLKKLHKHWFCYAPVLMRRSSLILEQTRFAKSQVWFQSKLDFFREVHEKAKPETLLKKARPSSWGVFSLITENLMLVSKSPSSPFPLGKILFEEFKVGPPSRAYLKLFEGLTFLGRILRSPGDPGAYPETKDFCLEIGASPGGWTWVLKNLGTKAITFDRAPLDPSLQDLPQITHFQKDGFTAVYERLEKRDDITWIFSDVICYPEKLLQWILSWLEKKPNLAMVCTLKFQGQEHAKHNQVILEFAKIPQSKLVHLYHNKHELTFIRHPLLDRHSRPNSPCIDEDLVI